MNNSITPFLFGENTVRTVIKEGEPWFVAKDVCAILGLDSVSQAVTGRSTNGGLDDDEAGICKVHSRSETGVEQTRDILIINEPGLYRLIFKSRKAEARAFQRWVFRDLLPTIRKTGRYGPRFHSGAEGFLALVRQQVALGITPDLAARCAAKLYPGPSRKELAMMELAAAVQEGTRSDAILAVMEPGQDYRIGDLKALLPADHPFLAKTEKGCATALGSHMERLARLGMVDQVRGRFATYRITGKSNIVSMDSPQA